MIQLSVYLCAAESQSDPGPAVLWMFGLVYRDLVGTRR
jgi:hypothetical protein